MQFWITGLRTVGAVLLAFAMLVLIEWPGLCASAAINFPEELVDPPNDSQPTRVEMSLYFDDVSRIDVFTHTYAVTGQLVMEWRDARLVPVLASQRGGRVAEYEGAEVVNILRQIWHPAIEISNEQNQRRVGVRALQLFPDGRIKLYEKFDSVPRLEGAMHLFPFVSAKLRLVFTATLQDLQELELLPRRFEFEAGERAETVIVGHWSFVSMATELKTSKRSDEPQILYPRVDFVMTVKREAFSGFITFILPLIMLALVSIPLLWLDPASGPPYGSPRVGGAVTLILTSVALQLTLRSRLPSVHYLVLMDYLFYLTLVMLTLSTVLTCYYVYLVTHDRKDAGRRLDRFIKVAYPVGFVALGGLAVLASAAGIG